MSMPSAPHLGNDLIVEEFRKLLLIKTRRDGNAVPAIAKGDCTIILQLIRLKIDNIGTTIDSRNPGRFRGAKKLTDDMKAVLGNVKPHLPKWGASHFRGQLRDDSQRGNKRHIIAFIDALNKCRLSSTDLEKAYHECIRLHHEFWEQFSLFVVFQATDELQSRVIKLLGTASLGRVQQGLVYSALRRRYGNDATITTKKTFAGDDQSSMKGASLRGDIQIYFQSEVGIAVEVKDAAVDEVAWNRVKDTHGEHEYALFVLATQFVPGSLQHEICGYRKTFALHLLDFFLTTIFFTSADNGLDPRDVLAQILVIYNDDFCDRIEDDASIKITVVEAADSKSQ